MADFRSEKQTLTEARIGPMTANPTLPLCYAAWRHGGLAMPSEDRYQRYGWRCRDRCHRSPIERSGAASFLRLAVQSE